MTDSQRAEITAILNNLECAHYALSYLQKELEAEHTCEARLAEVSLERALLNLRIAIRHLKSIELEVKP